MNGHLTSMDGFLMQRQAQALVVEHSVRFGTPAWFWKGEPIWFSKFGIGTSLVFVPGMAWASPLAPLVPMSMEKPAEPAEFYLRQLYENPFYTVGGAWVHAAVTALAAFLVARLVCLLGGSVGASLWAMAFYGVGSSALVYARGDFAQPLTGLCWTAALLFGLHVRRGAATWSEWACAAAVGYTILTRPLEGVMIVPAVVALVVPTPMSTWNLRTLRPALAALACSALAVAITLAFNWMRTGDPLVSGYRLDNGWSIPSLEVVAHVLAGPARGVLWEMPALVLAPLGAAVLVHRGLRREAGVLVLLCAALWLNTASWKMWWGGWCWGLRLFLPALPLLAVLAGLAIDSLRPGLRRWAPALLLIVGLVRALPGVVTDQLGGFLQNTDAAPLSWSLDFFAPYGAWAYMRRTFAVSTLDTGGVDILWFRMVQDWGYGVLAVPVVLLALALVLAWSSGRMRANLEATPGGTVEQNRPA